LAITLTAELVAEDAEGGGRIAKAFGHLTRGEFLEVIDAESLVLAMAWILGALEEFPAFRDR